MPPEVTQLVQMNHLHATQVDINEAEITEDLAAQPEEQDALIQEKSTKSLEVDSIEDLLVRLAEMNELFTQEKTHENIGDVEADAHESMYDVLCKRLLNKNRRLGQLNMRSWQAAIHHNFTTLRIEELEKEVKALRKTVYDLEDDHDFDNRKERFPLHLHELKRSNPYEFVLNADTVRLPTLQQPALEVRLPGGAPLKQVPSPASPKEDTTSNEESCHPDTVEKKPFEITPDRLRIRSRPLMFQLEQLTGTPIVSKVATDNVKGDKVYNSMVFLRPFQFFIKHEMAIRKSVADVEAELETESKTASGLQSDSKRSGLKQDKLDQQQFLTKDLLDDLKLLITFLDMDLHPTLHLVNAIKEGTAAEIEYADLKHLFRRGDIVVVGTYQAYARMVVNVAGGRDPLTHKLRDEDKETPIPVNGFAIDCISLGSSGTSVIPKLEQFSIRRFHGTQPISSLPIYPLKFDPNAKSLRNKFIQGGKHFSSITRDSFCHKRVVGKTVDEPSTNLDAEVIVDMTLAMNAKPEWRSISHVSTDDFTRNDNREIEEPPWCKHSNKYSSTCCGSDAIFDDLDLDDIDAQEFLKRTGHMLYPIAYEDLTDDHFMIMRPYVHAFVLRSRQWVTIRSEDLQEVVFRNNFDDLVVPDNHKTTVKALVTTHENARSPQSSISSDRSSIGSALDLVKGKGSGLVILLHGPPGVGKTSTAECVADDTKRPLFPITCGDIGETASEVEHNLQSNFQLAHKWGCVLLLDEADVFLAKRTRNDLRHNAVTSVFLRSLEYYAGILFLTTNRVGAMDPAFRSRIQMSLFYPHLSLDVTCMLYMKFIKRAKAEQQRQGSCLFKIKEKEIVKFGKKHFRVLEKEGYETWNGRQIRNAFQTAIALAEHQSMTMAPGDPVPTLGKEQFDTVARGFRQFDEYLNRTLGGTDADLARREGYRNDNFMMAGTNANPGVPIIPLANPQSSYHPRPKQMASQSAMNYEIGDDSDTETESDDDSDNDATQTGRRKVGTPAEGKSMTTSETPDDMDEFREYMMWKKRKSQFK
ncbi:hypothetical protein ACHAPO_011582 [Fusarium lateritium]